MANGRALTTSEGCKNFSGYNRCYSWCIIGHDAGQLIAEIVTTMEFEAQKI